MSDQMLQEHLSVTRRFFAQIACSGIGLSLLPNLLRAGELPRKCAEACEAFLKQMEYLTAQDRFADVSRGNPLPFNLPEEKKAEVGLTPETWQLEVISDDEHPAKLGQPLTREAGNALNWQTLMKLAEQHSVSFAKIMTCNNIGRPLGMGFWEGVPLREVLWMTRPQADLRRVFYSGYHNNDPAQLFRSSLPVGRVLEDPFDLPPVILCYKLNGQLLNGQRGGPVRMVVPEAYGFKSVKWLNRIVLSNLFHANDTYSNGNNDIDSGMKTFAAQLFRPDKIQAGQPIPVTGYAQVGVSGLSRVQTSVLLRNQEWPVEDPYFTQAEWTDAHILPPPEIWGGGLHQLPARMHGFDPTSGKPRQWPLRLSMAHWAAVLPPLPAGKYKLRCRTIDDKGIAQPLPRPFPKSGRNAIEAVTISVET